MILTSLFPTSSSYIIESSDCSLYQTGAVAVTNEQFSDADVPILLAGVTCSGSEPSILTCPNNTDSLPFCEAVEDAAVVCQGVCSVG